jgi:DnaK suppressor protein
LQKVRNALKRIKTGTYGYCAETGTPIGVKRLLAAPQASFCIDVQERKEREIMI